MFKKNISVLRSILERARNSEIPLVFTVPGSGLSAISATSGGIPFLLALNSGIYRMAGVTSHASFLPFGNANDQTEILISTQILPRCPDTPVVAGLLVGEPRIPLKERFRRMRELGVAGITNWPPASMLNGRFLEALGSRGFSQQRETEMLLAAKEAEFITFGFSASPESAELFVSQAKVDALIINVGWTMHGFEPLEKRNRIQYAIRQANLILESVNRSAQGPRPICLFYGGGVNTVQDMLQLYQHTNLDGLGVGSAIEYFPVKDLIQCLSREYLKISRKKQDIAQLLNSPPGFIGSSMAVLELYQTVRKVAAHDVNVCIEGESGTGKELIANSIHELSPRAMGPFITVNCGSIPETLIESELFGHERGAFTGAQEKKLGKFELACGGTLFLDEVGELSPRAQASLLRAIQQKEIVRVGGKKNIPVNIRIVTATNRSLKEMVKNGEFRADLFYRLNTINLYIPPLRDRKSDISELVRHLLQLIRKKFNCAATGVSKDFLRRLLEHSWPGNVRELQQVLTKAAIMEDGEILTGYTFTPDPRPVWGMRNNERGNFPDAREALNSALKKTGNNKTRSARLLGISRKTLYLWMQKYHLNYDDI